MSYQVIINATALDSSGALTILKQFIEAIPDDNYEYIIFTGIDVKLSLSQKNIKVIQKDVKSLRKRFQWDTFGINHWLNEKGIKPLATISLQNTNFRTNKSIPNFIYYHQSIPFFKRNWNPLKKEERTPWFYKKIYPFFVKIFINKNTEVFVQSNVIRNEFADYFYFPKEKIHIISPKIELPSFKETVLPFIDKSRLNLFYPASPFIYKNHAIILESLSLLDRDLQKKITLHLTCEMEELKHLTRDIETLCRINYLGKISFNEVLGMYKEADALLFPSYIETLGLPLIEAASFGLPIIVADLPYSRELLRNYAGVSYATFNNAIFWKEEISKLFALKGRRYHPIEVEKSNSWKELFEILENKINENV